MGKKECNRISRKVSEAGKNLASSKNKTAIGQAAKILSDHQHRYH